MRSCIAILTFNSISRLGSLFYKVIDAALNTNVDRVFVIDNDSQDNTIEIINSRYESSVEIIRLNRNYGFAGAYSLLYKFIKNKYFYLVILNDDYIIDAEGLKEILHTLKRSDIAIAQGINLLWGTSDVVLDAGAFLDIHGNVIRRFQGYRASECPPKESYISMANGACMTLDLKKIVNVRDNLFCKEYFMYAEDDELSMHLWTQGLKVVSVPVVAGYHRQGRLNTFSSYYLFRNRILNIRKYYVNKLRGIKMLITIRYLVKAMTIHTPLNRYSIKGVLDGIMSKNTVLLSHNKDMYYPLILVPKRIKKYLKSLVPFSRSANDYINEISKLSINDNMLKQSSEPYIVCI